MKNKAQKMRKFDWADVVGIGLGSIIPNPIEQINGQSKYIIPAQILKCFYF